MLAVASCTRYGVSAPEDLGLAARFDSQTLLITLPNDSDQKLARNQIINQWLLRSDSLCADYQLLLSRSIRDTRLATDFTATVLAGLATIFSHPAVTRPLSGAATIALGVGGDIQSDLFLQQAGDVVGTAIQAVRTRARTELQKKFAAEYADYTLEQGLVDVQRYDRETCNLNVGLNEIRASLNIVGPVATLANNPIIPLPPRGTEAGAASSPGSAMSGTTAPMASIVVPPSVQKTPEGGFVFTPGKIVNTPATAGAATTGAPTPPAAGPSSTSRPAAGLGSTSGRRFANTGGPLLPPPPPTSPCLTKEECALAPDRIKQYQTALCVEPTGVIGPQTRTAIHDYLVGMVAKQQTDVIDVRTKPDLDQAIGVNCAAGGFRSAYEVGRLGVPFDFSQQRIQVLQKDLGKLVKTSPAPEPNGILDSATRKAIAEVCPPDRTRPEGTFDLACRDSINKKIKAIQATGGRN